MKLRNKKTGEIATVDGFRSAEDEIQMTYTIDNDETKLYLYCTPSLTTFNEEWEDYEEPKEYWYIGIDGEIYKKEHEYFNEAQDNIGNRFETKEEAEKAVEKLEALTEAKEDGLKIKGYYYNHEDLVILADIGKCNKLTLDTLFGKEID